MKLRSALITVSVAAMAIGMAGCSNSSTNSGSGSSNNAPASSAAGGSDSGHIVIWQNGTDSKSMAFWQQVTSDFTAANPGVSFDIQVVQNEDFDGKLQTAMQAGTPPDVFLQRGGAKLQDQITAGMVQDLTSTVSSDLKTNMPVALGFDSIDGKIYGVPMSFQPEGFWYNSTLTDAANVKADPVTPWTLDEFTTNAAAIKAIGVAAVALGAQDAWPAAHWFYSFSLRECSKDVVQSLANPGQDMSDPCWLRALNDVKTVLDAGVFNDGFLTTVAQQGATSSAGMVANGQAAMELMGAWEPGVIGGLTPDQQPLPTLRFTPFVTTTTGQGDPAAMMAGADGYSCSTKAPEPACTDFLNFMGQQKYVESYATAYSTLPSRSDASSVVTDQSLKDAMQAYAKAPYVSLWFDTELGQDAGNAVNAAVVALLSGTATPDQALSQMQQALQSR